MNICAKGMEHRIKDLLMSAKTLSPISSIKIDDFGDACGAKFAVHIESSVFNGLSLINQHRLVNDALTPIRPEIHALTIIKMLAKASPSQHIMKSSSASPSVSTNNTTITLDSGGGGGTVTITPPSSTTGSGVSSSAGSHSPNEHSLSYRSSTGDDISMMLMMENNLNERKSWFSSQRSASPSSGYPTPPFQETSNGIHTMMSMLSPSTSTPGSSSGNSFINTHSAVTSMNNTKTQSDSSRPTIDNTTTSPAHHRTSSTPNIHYPFTPDLSTSASSTVTSASNIFQHHHNQHYTNSAGGYPRQYAYYQQQQQQSPSQQQMASYCQSMPTASRSQYLPSIASGYSPLAFTHEQQAQYLYALYQQQQQQIQSQVKDDQSQRLLMYAQGFPQDSLMYYSSGTTNSNNRQNPSTLPNGNPDVNSNGLSSVSPSPPSSSSGARGSPPSSTSPLTSYTDENTVDSHHIQHLDHHYHQQQLFNQSHHRHHHQYTQQHLYSNHSADGPSSSSSGINTPPNSGSMSFTSSPSTQPIKDPLDISGHSSNSNSQSTITSVHNNSNTNNPGASSLYSTYALGMYGSDNSAIGSSSTNQHHMLAHSHHLYPQQHSYSIPTGYMSSSNSSAAHHSMHAYTSSSNIPGSGVMIGNNAVLPSTIKICSNCGCTSTPSWRRCPTGKQLLCNACGLYQKLHNKPRPFCVLDDGSVKVQRNAFLEATRCGHCHTTETPLWRRGSNGQSLCNACGLYFKQHRQYRPSLPNTGWLSTGGYDAEMINGGSHGISPSNISAASATWIQSNSSVSSTTPPSPSSTSNVLGGHHLSNHNDLSGTGKGLLILDEHLHDSSEFSSHLHSSSDISTQYQFHHQQQPVHTHDEESIDQNSGMTSRSTPSNTNHHNHSMLISTHGISAEDEAAVSALAEQMLDAQELFTREEDPGVLAAVAVASKMIHFERNCEGPADPAAC